MLVFGLCSTSVDQLGWLMDSNPLCHPSQANKMKCSFLDYIQLLMTGRAGQWTRTLSATLSSQKNEMLIFGLRSTSDDWPSDPSYEWWLKCKKGLLIHQKMECSFSDGLPEDCQKTTRRLSEDYQKTSRRTAEDHQKTARRPVEDCQKTTRRLHKDCQKTTRRLSEDHQKASGSLLVVF